MPSLTAPALDAIRETLTAERAALLSSVSSLTRDEATLMESKLSGERTRGEGEGDAVAVERALVAQLGAQAQTALAEIDAALARLDDGSYGTCEKCTGPIPIERLEVRPRATICVPCAARR